MLYWLDKSILMELAKYLLEKGIFMKLLKWGVMKSLTIKLKIQSEVNVARDWYMCEL